MGFGLPERSMAVDDEFGSEALSKGARKELAMVEDPKSYQALAYSPPKSADGRPPPLLVRQGSIFLMCIFLLTDNKNVMQ